MLFISFTFQILLIMSHPPLVSSLVDVLVNGDEVASGCTPEDSPLPLRKVSVCCQLLIVLFDCLSENNNDSLFQKETIMLIWLIHWHKHPPLKTVF